MPKRYLDKINAKGQYTEYPGITVIANTSKEENDVWKQIHDVLNNSNLVSSYFAPLPQTSYHMTAINLFTEMDDGGENWGAFVTDRLPALRELTAQLETSPIHPQVKLKSIRTSSVIQLQVELPPEQRELLEQVAETFNLRHKVPKEMHITLAYQYKLVTGTDHEQLEQYLQEEIERIFDKNPIVTFQTPELAYFKNMERFTPWDARRNPFIIRRFNFFQCFSASDDEPQDPTKRISLN